jgi:nucleoside-diphosphate-sugar epimerase
MRIVIFGANGPTGRLLTRLSLTAGYDTVAVTRQPGAFGLQDPRLRVAGADVLDADAVDGVVKGSDAVLSALGVPFGKAPVEVYSRGAEHMLDAMKRHDVGRLVVVSSGAVTGQDEPTGGFLFNRVLQPYVTKRLGKTVYDDMRRMEAMVSDSDLAWTIVRPSGLFEAPVVSEYAVAVDYVGWRFTARIDLADCLLRQALGETYVRSAIAVATPDAKPSMLKLIWNEGIRKKS